MHPAYSVIFFTTASGAGYGLLIWLSLAAALGLINPEPRHGVIGLGLALALITLGLLSSTLHLGRPERAWRALSQWRTSWLSREGVLAIATYIPAALLGIGWVFLAKFSGVIAISAWLSAILALSTVVTTGMIYACLPTIRAWHQPLVMPIYIALALATGGILYNVLQTLLASGTTIGTWLAILSLAVAWIMKITYWSVIDGARRTLTPADAIGLGKAGTVRPLDPPHTTPNYVMREMGYVVARKHARKLRILAAALLFAIPITGLGMMLLAGPSLATLVIALLVTASAALGVWTERWLFFAEAQHVVTLYYGASQA